MKFRCWAVAAACVIPCLLGASPAAQAEIVLFDQVTNETSFNETSFDLQPSVSPLGTEIAFASDRLGQQSIYVVDIQGGTPTQVTQETSFEADPAWSPNSLKIYFTSDRSGNFDIWSADATGFELNLTQVTTSLGNETQPAVSKAGNGLAYVSDVFAAPTIFVVTDTIAFQQTPSALHDADPAFSPDGTALVYASSPTGASETWDLYTIGVGDMLGMEVPLTNETGFDELDPQFSADGQWVYFTLRDWQNESSFNESVYRVPSAGGAIEPFIVDSGVFNHSDPAPSPANPNVLAYVSDEDGDADIWTRIEPALLAVSPSTVGTMWHPPSQSVIEAATKVVEVTVTKAFNMGAFEFDMVYDGDVVQVSETTDVVLGSFLGSTGNTAAPLGPNIDNQAGVMEYAGFSFGPNPGASGAGVLAGVTLSSTPVVEVVTTTIPLENIKITDKNGIIQPSALTGTATAKVCYFADRNCDNQVSIVDIQLVAGAWNTFAGGPGYDPDKDVNNDGQISIVDIQLVAGVWNTFAPF